MFRFKEFSIVQENSAMKVCTDSCLFGSLIDTNDRTLALDIGTGTGLLALMVGQKNRNLQIHAVEISENAAVDAKVNVSQNNNIELFIQDIKDHINSLPYDLIFCNPPFYEHDLSSSDADINMAKHSSKLNLKALLEVVLKHITPTGQFWIICPPKSFTEFENMSGQANFKLQKKYDIYHQSHKPLLRNIGMFSFEKNENLISEAIYIHENGHYSDRFTGLMKDYYLNL